MKNRIKVIIYLIVIGVSIILFHVKLLYSQDDFLITRFEITKYSETSFTVFWEANKESNSRLYYGTDEILNVPPIEISESVYKHELTAILNMIEYKFSIKIPYQEKLFLRYNSKIEELHPNVGKSNIFTP